MLKNAIKYLSIVLIVVYIILFASIKIFNLNIKIAKGDSMQPNICSNDILVIKKFDNYNIGDIIEFEYKGLNITHRITAKTIDNNQVVYYTLGDNNNKFEVVYHNNIKGKVLYQIPKLGLLYKLVNYFAILITLGGVCVVATNHKFILH